MATNVYDLCIIGAGMFGSAAARHASANPSLKVCLIGPVESSEGQMGKRKIYGCHCDEARIIAETKCGYEVANLNKQSISRYRELEQLSGIPFYFPVGYLKVGENDSSHQRNSFKSDHSNNSAYVDLSHEDLLKKRFPFLRLNEDDHPLWDDNGTGYISARKIVKAQQIVARTQGCDVIEDTVVQVKTLSGEMHEILTESKGRVEAKRILICTGALTNFMKFEPLKRLKIELNMETFILLNVDEEEAQILSSMPSMVYRKRTDNMPPNLKGAYILPPVQYPDGQSYLKAGPVGCTSSKLETMKDVKEWYNSKGDPDTANSLFTLIKNLIPSLKTSEMDSKTCITCNSPSGLPYIDRITPTVTIAVVGNGTGASLAEEVGRIAAELSITGKWDSELSKELFVANFEDE